MTAATMTGGEDAEQYTLPLTLNAASGLNPAAGLSSAAVLPPATMKGG